MKIKNSKKQALQRIFEDYGLTAKEVVAFTHYPQSTFKAIAELPIFNGKRQSPHYAYKNATKKVQNILLEKSYKQRIKNLVMENEALKNILATFDVKIQEMPEGLNTLIVNTNLSQKARNVLYNENIYYVGQLVQKTELDLIKIPCLGRKTLQEIKGFLMEHNLHLEMKVKNWKMPEINSKGR